MERIILSEINQTKKEILYDIAYIWNLKKAKPMNIAKKKQTHRYREQTSGLPVGREEGGARLGQELKGTNDYVQNK